MKYESNETLRVSTEIIKLVNYGMVLTSRKGYYPSAKVRPNRHQTRTSGNADITYNKQSEKKKSFCG
jgi:hypothetical protein